MLSRRRHGFDDSGPTLTEALAALGITHRAAPERQQGREVIDADGESLGVLTARDGWILARAREAAARIEAGT